MAKLHFSLIHGPKPVFLMLSIDEERRIRGALWRLGGEWAQMVTRHCASKPEDLSSIPSIRVKQNKKAGMVQHAYNSSGVRVESARFLGSLCYYSVVKKKKKSNLIELKKSY